MAAKSATAASLKTEATGAAIAAAPVLEVSAALHAEFSASEEMERSKIVMQASQRMPAVGFYGGRYGERWYVDMVALPHNAVRRQLYDAFLIANALGKMVLDVTDADLSRVYAWLAALEKLVDATLYAEDRYLFPLVETSARKSGLALPDMLSAGGRSSAKSQIRELLSSARKTRDVATGESTAKINALRYALDQFGANILDYYNAMEGFVPKLFRQSLRHGEKEKQKFERRMFDQLLSEPQGYTLAALLMQCIESRSKRSAFLSRNIKKERHRDVFKAQVKRVQNTHMLLARAFDDAANKYERRFGVKTFLQHYGSNVDAGETLRMLAEVDINAEQEEDPAPIPAANIARQQLAETLLLEDGNPLGRSDIQQDTVDVYIEQPLDETPRQALIGE